MPRIWRIEKKNNEDWNNFPRSMIWNHVQWVYSSMIRTSRAVMTVPTFLLKLLLPCFKKAQPRSWNAAKYMREYENSWKRSWLSTCSTRSWWIKELRNVKIQFRESCTRLTQHGDPKFWNQERIRTIRVTAWARISKSTIIGRYSMKKSEDEELKRCCVVDKMKKDRHVIIGIIPCVVATILEKWCICGIRCLHRHADGET